MQLGMISIIGRGRMGANGAAPDARSAECGVYNVRVAVRVWPVGRRPRCQQFGGRAEKNEVKTL